MTDSADLRTAEAPPATDRPAQSCAPEATSPPHLELRIPEKSPLDLAIGFALIAFAIFWLRPLFSFTRFHGDEGIPLQGAVRILNGEIPYRDFFSFYTPGSYYVYALVFRLFGTSLAVGRAVLVFYAASFSWITYMLARRACSRGASILAALFLTLVCLPGDFVITHSWDSIAAAVLALYFAVWLLQTGHVCWAFFCGWMAGLTAMMEQSRGGGLLLGLAIAGLVLQRLQPQRWKLRHLLWLVAGAAIPVVMVIGYFAAHDALGPMFAGWWWPLDHYTAVNKLPFGYLLWGEAFQQAFSEATPGQRAVMLFPFSGLFMVALLPVLAVCLTGLVAMRVVRRRLDASPTVTFVLLCGCVLFGELAAFAAGRPDWHHIEKLAPLSFLFLPLLLDSRLIHAPTLSRLRPLVALWLVPAFAATGFLLSLLPRSAAYMVTTRRGVVRTELPDQVLPFLQAHVPAGEKVLIYPYAPLYSFLSATMTPTRFEYLQAGLHTPAQFEEARKELEADRTAVVLFDLGFRGIIPTVWPTTPLHVIASDPMGDYIFRHYKVCKTLIGLREPFAYMMRNDLACPAER